MRKQRKYCTNSKLFKMLFTLLLSTVATFSFAQNRSISGIVTDERDEPVIGANVVVKGTSVGTITDMTGKFTLSIPKNTPSIEVSYLGYNNKTVPVQNKDFFNVQLSEGGILLDEVVAIGYGTAKKGNVTGSIARVTSEKLEDRPVSNIAQSLQGQLAGVEVRSTTGEPGQELQIRIRGAASINAGADPLYVLDGIPVDNLSGINPNDIQSLEVLKDASSSAIYGSRGANGVVLITTKQGSRDSKVTVQFSASFGVQSLERKVDVLSPQEWIDFRTDVNNRGYVDRWGAKGATANDNWDTRRAMIGSVNYSYMNDPRWTEAGYGGLHLIDWQDAFFRTAPMQDYQLSVSGGQKNSSFRISLGYVNQEGVAIETDYKRLNLRANAESRIFDRVKIGMSVAPSVAWGNGGRVDGKDAISHRVLSMTPITEPDAGLNTAAEPYQRYMWATSSVSPIAYMEQTTNYNEDVRINSSAYVKADIWNGLNAEVTASWNFTNTEMQQFIPSSVQSKWSSGEGVETTARRRDVRSHKLMAQALLNYNKKFGKHSVSAMLGYSAETTTGASSSNLQAKGFPNNSLEVFDQKNVTITAATAELTTPSRLLSYFGRIQYDFDDRYLLTFSMRRDGSSRFGSDNRWGTFPAISGAWRISNEKFWNKDFLVNSLKLRGSWGANGNNSIPTNAALGVLSNANYSFGGSSASGYAPTSSENTGLGWEKTESWNVAMDMGLFNNRIFISADYYTKKTQSLLYQVTVPAVVGYSKGWFNIGSIENKGWELELTTQNITGKFNWSTSFNIGYNKNEVLSLGSDNSTVYTGFSSTTQLLKVGEPLRAYYMYDAVGVYQTSEDLEKYPKMASTKVGDVRYRDVDGDGKIDSNDRTIVGKPSPDYTYGLTNTFRYKGFDLSILLTGQSGGKVYGLLGRAIDRPGMGASTNVLACWKNMWRSEENPGDGKTPGLSSTTSSLYDTRWLYSSDFIKIKNLTIGYKLPIKKHVGSIRVYVTAENLYMWDKYDGGFSPESNNGGSDGDYDYGAYPQARVISAGVNIVF